MKRLIVIILLLLMFSASAEEVVSRFNRVYIEEEELTIHLLYKGDDCSGILVVTLVSDSDYAILPAYKGAENDISLDPYNYLTNSCYPFFVTSVQAENAVELILIKDDVEYLIRLDGIWA